MPYRAFTIRFQALCTSLHGVLFSFPSRYYCTIGLKTYLVLEVGVSQIPVRYPTYSTQDQTTILQITSTWLSHSLAFYSKKFRLNWFGSYIVCLITPHLLFLSERIQFELCCVHSRLLTASL